MLNLRVGIRSLVGDYTTTGLPFGATTLRPAIRPARQFRADPLEFMRTRARGRDLVRLHLGFTEFYLVTKPELIRQILVGDDARFGEGKWTQRARFVMGECLITKEGISHQKRRRLLQPVFRAASAAIGRDEILDVVDRYTARWRDGDVVEMRVEMGRIALAVSCCSLFAEDVQTHYADVFEDLWLLNSNLARPPFPRPRLRAALSRLRVLVSTPRQGEVVRCLRDSGANEAEIDQEIIALMIASIDTTPGTLAWVWTRLAEHPTIERVLHEELISSFDKSPARVDAPTRFETIDGVVSETLRLHPPVRFIDRRVLETMTLSGVTVRAGDYVLLSPLFSHRDERFWNNPDEFDPARWSRRDREGQSAYFPFGAGAHACIGRAQASRVVSTVVSELARRWRFHPLSVDPSTHLIPARFDMRLESRS